MAMLTIGAIIAALAAATAAGGAYAGTQIQNQKTREYFKNYIRDNYGQDLSESQVDALYAQYQNEADKINWNDPRTYINLFGGPLGWAISGIGTAAGAFPEYGAGTFDTAGVDNTMAKVRGAYDVLGEAPQQLSDSEIANIRENAYQEIDNENRQLLDLYNQSFNNSRNLLESQLQENAQMFGDYRNQILTNEAMRQQAIAGSTRYELDRQQRNAITRGASAAQRLVANINTQLGLQAQSAQQSLDTSNALAQNLLAHRQAQQGIRNSYLDAQSRFDAQRADLIRGQSERRFNYGQSKVGAAEDDRQRAYDSWVDRRDDYFRGDSLASGIYGSGRRNNNGI